MRDGRGIWQCLRSRLQQPLSNGPKAQTGAMAEQPRSTLWQLRRAVGQSAGANPLA